MPIRPSWPRLTRSSKKKRLAAALFRGALPCHSRDVAGVVGNSSDLACPGLADWFC